MNDVVQVINNESKYFGMLFIVGDIRQHLVHGYYLLINGLHEYITVNSDEIVLVGKKAPNQIRSRKSCSPKWGTERIP